MEEMNSTIAFSGDGYDSTPNASDITTSEDALSSPITTTDSLITTTIDPSLEAEEEWNRIRLFTMIMLVIMGVNICLLARCNMAYKKRVWKTRRVIYEIWRRTPCGRATTRPPRPQLFTADQMLEIRRRTREHENRARQAREPKTTVYMVNEISGEKIRTYDLPTSVLQRKNTVRKLDNIYEEIIEPTPVEKRGKSRRRVSKPIRHLRDRSNVDPEALPAISHDLLADEGETINPSGTITRSATGYKDPTVKVSVKKQSVSFKKGTVGGTSLEASLDLKPTKKVKKDDIEMFV